MTSRRIYDGSRFSKKGVKLGNSTKDEGGIEDYFDWLREESRFRGSSTI
jgi:hypothetical protein